MPVSDPWSGAPCKICRVGGSGGEKDVGLPGIGGHQNLGPGLRKENARNPGFQNDFSTVLGRQNQFNMAGAAQGPGRKHAPAGAGGIFVIHRRRLAGDLAGLDFSTLAGRRQVQTFVPDQDFHRRPVFQMLRPKITKNGTDRAARWRRRRTAISVG